MKKKLGAIAVACLGLYGTLPAGAAPLVGPHPAYEILLARPDAYKPQASGLALMPNGDLLVLHWRGNTGGPSELVSTGTPGDGRTDTRRLTSRSGVGSLYRLKGAKGRDHNAIQVQKIADNFTDAHGVVVVDGQIYIGDIDKVLKLVDKDGDGIYETNQVVGRIPSWNGHYEFSFGPVHKNGTLYMALAVCVSTGGWPVPQFGADRGTLVSVPVTGGDYEVVASGLRAPNGIGIGPFGSIYITDNQGGYRPASLLTEVKEGRHYGYMVTPPAKFQDRPVTPPTTWLPHGELNISPTQPALVKSGTYAGQLIYGDITQGGLYRAFLEKVLDPSTSREEIQGGVIMHSGGFEMGIDRIEIADDGVIFLGGLGTGGQWNGAKFGLQKMVPKPGVSIFEILAVRSRKNGMEIEFTQPVAADAGQAAKYAVQQWRYEPTSNYGGSKVGTVTVPVAAVQVSADRKSVFLSIPGLKTGHVVGITANGVVSHENKPLWSNKAYYTLNFMSESAPFQKPSRLESKALQAKVLSFQAWRSPLGDLHLALPSGDAVRVMVTDPAGRVVASAMAAGGILFPRALFRPGVYLVQVGRGTEAQVKRVLM